MSSTAAQKQAAHVLVTDFRSRSSNVVWLSIQRAQVADDLDLRIDKPELISQNDTMWCGYASILFSIADREPETYAKFIIGLFEHGRWSLTISRDGPAVPIAADESIRRGYLPRIKTNTGTVETIPQADYVGLASLREHFKTTAAGVVETLKVFNWIKDLHGSQGGELCDALKKLGCKHTYDQSSVFSTRDLGYLNSAGGHQKSGRIVLVFIDASLLNGGGNKGRANHWVALTSDVSYSPDRKRVMFEVFSWGQKYSVDEPVDVVKARFFGYVVGY
jgi:hypothetical protein